MKVKISKDTLISDLLAKVPGSDKVLIEDFGIFCAGCPMAAVETLAQGAQAHGLGKKELEKLIKKLKSLAKK
jgi:hybrid cluster-associated redox disulfide protein